MSTITPTAAAEKFPDQVGIMKDHAIFREPSKCAVSGRLVRGKHSIRHDAGDKKHFVYVLSQFDEKWSEAAPSYGFPVHDAPTNEVNTFVLTNTSEVTPTGVTSLPPAKTVTPPSIVEVVTPEDDQPQKGKR